MMNISTLKSQNIHLKLATLRNRKSIFNWMTKSDISKQMFGPPTFPEEEAPDWEEFLEDYTENYFTDELPLNGRCFIIKKGRKHIGQINYNPINVAEKQVELDIWLANSSVTRKGYGTAAILILCEFLQKEFGCQKFILQPSARNPIAVKAYQKIGFKIVKKRPVGMVADYKDSVFLIKKVAK